MLMPYHFAGGGGQHGGMMGGMMGPCGRARSSTSSRPAGGVTWWVIMHAVPAACPALQARASKRTVR